MIIDPSGKPALRRQTQLLKILLLDRSCSNIGETHHLAWRNEKNLPNPVWQELQVCDLDKLTLARSRRELIGLEVRTPLAIVAEMNRQVDYQSGHWPADRTNWQVYVADPKLEICCGLAPFIANYGPKSAPTNRVGFLDRKLQAVSRFCSQQLDWLHWAKIAYQSSYGYELHGDKLFLARENLLYTFVDFWNYQFSGDKIDLRRKLSSSQQEILESLAEIISWNLFQMDGLTYRLPHANRLAKITDWQSGEVINFQDLFD